MNTFDNVPPAGGKPPAGLIAAGLMQNEMKPAKTVDKTVDTVVNSFPNVDPGYKEPVSVLGMRQQYVDGVPLPEVLEAAFTRIDVLEKALLPFAERAMQLANMHMCLAGAGRDGEPAGGTWLNGIDRATMQQNEVLFYFAADAYGRKRVEDHVMDVFKKVQAVQDAAAERDAHIADTTRQGGTGAPINGRVH